MGLFLCPACVAPDVITDIFNSNGETCIGENVRARVHTMLNSPPTPPAVPHLWEPSPKSTHESRLFPVVARCALRRSSR
jgi:hypothetical protein